MCENIHKNLVHECIEHVAVNYENQVIEEGKTYWIHIIQNIFKAD